MVAACGLVLDGRSDFYVNATLPSREHDRKAINIIEHAKLLVECIGIFIVFVIIKFTSIKYGTYNCIRAHFQCNFKV